MHLEYAIMPTFQTPIIASSTLSAWKWQKTIFKTKHGRYMARKSGSIFARVNYLMLVLRLIIRMFSTKSGGCGLKYIYSFFHFHCSVWLVIWRILFSGFFSGVGTRDKIYTCEHILMNTEWNTFIFLLSLLDGFSIVLCMNSYECLLISVSKKKKKNN